MHFTKMQGTGNDFIVLDCLDGMLPQNIGSLSKKICDRHFGIGADGLVCVLPGEHEKFRMLIWNADGTQAAMCGNASRCIAVYLKERGILVGDEFTLETSSGDRRLRVYQGLSLGLTVEVDMGIPLWEDSCLPNVARPQPILNYPVMIQGREFRINCVSMGNPHCVIYTDELDDGFVGMYGPLIERHPLFPDRTNVEFTRIVSQTEARVRVWERGCGETLACGTGASAVFAVSSALGLVGRQLDCIMQGGVLRLSWSSSGNDSGIVMSGPAKRVFEGMYEEETNS
jgi:diaminopimelate epimerase